jgi:hypothetical protein
MSELIAQFPCIALSYYSQFPQAFAPSYLSELCGQILASPYFAINNLNRDFIGTKGFSLVFQRSHLSEVCRQFPYFKPYLSRVLEAGCNAFYLNPLWLEKGSRVDPHLDRSLRSYCPTINPPLVVSVLYIKVPKDLVGGELVLRSGNRLVGQITPQTNTLICFQGDLIHSVNQVLTSGVRLSLVCEQYSLNENQLWDIPTLHLESRALKAGAGKKKGHKVRFP